MNTVGMMQIDAWRVRSMERAMERTHRNAEIQRMVNIWCTMDGSLPPLAQSLYGHGAPGALDWGCCHSDDGDEADEDDEDGEEDEEDVCDAFVDKEDDGTAPSVLGGDTCGAVTAAVATAEGIYDTTSDDTEQKGKQHQKHQQQQQQDEVDKLKVGTKRRRAQVITPVPVEVRFRDGDEVPPFVDVLVRKSKCGADGKVNESRKNRRSAFLHLLATDPRVTFVRFATPLHGQRYVRGCDLIVSDRVSLCSLVRTVYGSDSTLSHHFWHLRDPSGSGSEYWRCKTPKRFGPHVPYYDAILHSLPRGHKRETDIASKVWCELSDH